MGLPPEDRALELKAPSDDAGPLERKLYDAVRANLGNVATARSDWDAGATKLDEVAKLLEGQAEQLQLSYGNTEGSTGYAASQAYLRLAKVVRKRQTEMTNVAEGLGLAGTAVVSGRDSYRALSPLPLKGSQISTTGTPDAQQAQIDAQDAQRAQAIAQREKAASAALKALDSDYQTAAEKMGAPRPLEVPTTDTSSGSSSTVGTSTGTGTTKPRSGVITSIPVDPVRPPTGTTTTTPTETGPEPTLVVPVTEHPGGHLENPATNPAPTNPTLTPVNSGSGGSTSIGGGAGTVAAAGAAVVSGAGSVLASRGVTPSGVVPGGSTGQIGKSSTTAARGALGRGGTGVLPGQGGTPGQRGAAGGRPAARGVVPGANGQTAGRAGGRKAPLAASATGGRGGKRDGDDQGRDHFEYDDSQSWLDDDTTGDAVID